MSTAHIPVSNGLQLLSNEDIQRYYEHLLSSYEDKLWQLATAFAPNDDDLADDLEQCGRIALWHVASNPKMRQNVGYQRRAISKAMLKGLRAVRRSHILVPEPIRREHHTRRPRPTQQRRRHYTRPNSRHAPQHWGKGPCES